MDKVNKIHPTAIIGDNVKMGKGNEIGPYTVIGEMGFLRNSSGPAAKIIVGDNNRIGNYISIMAGKDGKTVIGNGNLLMNYVNIGHNCTIGDNNEIGAGTIVCGHTNIGNGNKIKTGCDIRNRITIGNDNLIGIASNIVANVGNNERWYGNPARYISPMPKDDRSNLHKVLEEREK